MVARDKLLAEGSLSETKIILGWLFNFRTLNISLLDHKFITWMAAIKMKITSGHTTLKEIDTTIKQMGHVGFMIPWVYHFLNSL
jgi:hypothetical protein